MSKIIRRIMLYIALPLVFFGTVYWLYSKEMERLDAPLPKLVTAGIRRHTMDGKPGAAFYPIGKQKLEEESLRWFRFYLKDPDSLKDVDMMPLLYGPVKPNYILVVDYRAKNSYGAYGKGSVWFVVSPKGEILDGCEDSHDGSLGEMLRKWKYRPNSLEFPQK